MANTHLVLIFHHHYLVLLHHTFVLLHLATLPVIGKVHLIWQGGDEDSET